MTYRVKKLFIRIVSEKDNTSEKERVKKLFIRIVSEKDNTSEKEYDDSGWNVVLETKELAKAIETLCWYINRDWEVKMEYKLQGSISQPESK